MIDVLLMICLSISAEISLFKGFFDLFRGEEWNIKLFQFKTGMSYRNIFWRLKTSNQMNVILDVKYENILESSYLA